MPVQPIKQDGVVVGFQARHANASKYFAVAKHGHDSAYELASRTERRLRREIPRAPRGLQANNRSGVAGIRALYSNTEDPVLYIQASWRRRGKPGSTWFSTEKHGRIGAVELAIAARERGSGKPVGLTPRQVWARIQYSLEH